MHGMVAQIGSAGRQAMGETEQQAAAGGETPAGGGAGAGTPTVGAAGEDAATGGDQGGGDAAGGGAGGANPRDAGTGGGAVGGSGERPENETDAGGDAESGGTELRVGRTASFEDGAVRVFLSAVTPEARTARVAVNGFAVTTLEMGAPATIENCELELTDVRRDGATLDVRCDASGQQQGEGAVQAPRTKLVGNEGAPAEGSQTSAELAPGQALVVGDGDMRLFVSAVDAERGQVRIAVNGTEVISLAVGDTHEANGCSVGLNGFEGRSAVLNYSC
jgi:hypothetical protein